MTIRSYPDPHSISEEGKSGRMPKYILKIRNNIRSNSGDEPGIIPNFVIAGSFNIVDSLGPGPVKPDGIHIDAKILVDYEQTRHQDGTLYRSLRVFRNPEIFNRIPLVAGSYFQYFGFDTFEELLTIFDIHVVYALTEVRGFNEVIDLLSASA